MIWLAVIGCLGGLAWLVWAILDTIDASQRGRSVHTRRGSVGTFIEK